MAYRFKVIHRSQDEIIVPVSAIDDNIVFIASGKDKELEFTDGVIMSVVRKQEIHPQKDREERKSNAFTERKAP